VIVFGHSRVVPAKFAGVSWRTTHTLRRLQDQNMTAIRPQIKVGPAPLRAANIARQLLGLVESGYFEQRPHKDEQMIARWLTHAIAELDKLRTVREPAAVLDRLDALLIELAELPDPQSEPATTAKPQLATAN
jgi:hypothetical protein